MMVVVLRLLMILANDTFYQAFKALIFAVLVYKRLLEMK